MSPQIAVSPRLQFFDLIFEEQSGFLCIASGSTKFDFAQAFFEWPKDAIQMEEHITRESRNKNVWFGVNLLTKRDRKKEYCRATNLIWADLDEVDPDSIDPPPSIVVESSPGRYQAYWRVTEKLDPAIAESYAKRIAYSTGADKGGWDLTQLLRVPYTGNFKYDELPTIRVKRSAETKLAPMLLEVFQGEVIDVGIEQPTKDELPSLEAILVKYGAILNRTQFKAVFTMELNVGDDWSKQLWRLIHICLESGMSREETFVCAYNSNVNKYVRDKRPSSHLWRDVVKAVEAKNKLTLITTNIQQFEMPELVDLDDRPTNQFVNQYREWAVEATDAVEEFHDLCAFMLLSSIVSNSVRLPTSYGTIVPNLWGLILGDSTLTRKTTAMRMIMEYIGNLDKEMILASDGSVEGLLSGLEQRPNKTSIFFKDEVSGFFDSINKKDYLAGMPETLTALYDVPPFFTRRLRKETIMIENPVFIFFGGGVRERVFETVSEEFIVSGFLPRFIVISGETNMSKLRRTGPATEVGQDKKSALMAQVADLYEVYAKDTVPIMLGGQRLIMPAQVGATLTSGAWELYGNYEMTMLERAQLSDKPHLALPTFERLSRSLLKMAVILGAVEKPPQAADVVVTERNVHEAGWFIQQWGRYSIELILAAGRKSSERVLERVLKVIERHPGILRSTLMQHYHLTKREADEILMTLEDRQLVQKQPAGRGYAYWAI